MFFSCLAINVLRNIKIKQMNKQPFFKITVIVLLCASCGFNAMAQEEKTNRFAFGIDAGTTVCRIYTKVKPGFTLENGPDKNQQPKLGFYAGAVATFKIKKRLKLISSISYLQNTYSYEQPNGFYLQPDSSYAAMHTKAKEVMNSLLLLSDARYHFSTNTSSFFLQAGGAAGFYTGSKQHYASYLDEDESLLNEKEIKGRYSTFNSWNYYLRIGSGYSLKLSKSLVATLQLNGNFALRNILSDKVAFNANHKIHFIQAGLQITYIL